VIIQLNVCIVNSDHTTKWMYCK